MRKLVLQMQISVDGFVAADSAHDWQLWGWGDGNRWDMELREDFNAFFATVETIVLSRKMAEDGYVAHWTNAAKNYPADPFYAFARRIVEVEKVVLSDRLKKSHWDRTVIGSGNLPKEVRALKSTSGGVIVAFGGVSFAAALLAADLVDEIQFYINPAALGRGSGVFGQSGFRSLRLLGSKAYSCGMVVNRYAPADRR